MVAMNLGALGGGIQQGYNTGYDQTLKIASDIAFGRTLQMLGAGQQPMQPFYPPTTVGQGPQPMPPQMAGGPPVPQGGPPVGVSPQASPIGAPAPQPPVGGPIGRSGNPPPTQMQPSPPQGGQLPMQPQGFGQQQPMLDWRQIFAAVQRANPGVPPQVIAGAVNKAIPLMNAQSQMEWRNFIMPQLAQERIAVQARGQDIAAGTRERGQDITAGTAAANRESRERVAGENIQSREKVATQREAGTQERFNIREARITAHQMVTTDQAWQRLDQQRKAAEQRFKQSEDRQSLMQWRAILDAQHKRATEIIQAYSANSSMPDKQRQQLLKDADQAYNDAIKQMSKGDKASFSDRFQGGGQPSP